MLTRTAEHALRAVLFLARQRSGDAVPAASIAAALDAPANYLGKTLQALVAAGVLESLRGPRGGFRLLRRADELTLAELVGLVEEPKGPGMCLLGDRPCSSETPCAAHGQWLKVQRASAEPFRRTTIADLLDGSGQAA